MTEVGPLGLIMPSAQSANKYGSSGLPSMFASVTLVGPDGAEVPVGSVGELLVKGPAVTSGYWKRPDATRSAFTEAGWFRTGDAAYRDHDGYYYVVDRWKDMFISGGENVYPAEVERVIALLPGVAECAVVAMNDEKWGEVGRAFVVRQPTSGIQAEDLRLHCQRHLARYKIPKEFVFLEMLPHNSTGKVLKAKLREASAVQSGGS
jgi:fatty-acyl-CoA synthase